MAIPICMMLHGGGCTLPEYNHLSNMWVLCEQLLAIFLGWLNSDFRTWLITASMPYTRDVHEMGWEGGGVTSQLWPIIFIHYIYGQQASTDGGNGWQGIVASHGRRWQWEGALPDLDWIASIPNTGGVQWMSTCWLLVRST